MFWWILYIVYTVEGQELDARFIVKDMVACDALIRSELLEEVRKTHPTANAYCEETNILRIRPRARPEQ